MISPIEYIQLKAFARQDGFFMGLMWIAMFFCFFNQVTNPELQMGFLIGFIATPFVLYVRLKHFRNKVLEGFISYRRALLFCGLTMFYASLILAAATFAYFYFLDDGKFLAMLVENTSLPEIRKSFQEAGMDPKELDAQVSEIAQSRPIDFAFSIFINGTMSSMLLAMVIAFIGKKSVKVVDQ